jgi:hypothetical protein
MALRNIIRRLRKLPIREFLVLCQLLGFSILLHLALKPISLRGLARSICTLARRPIFGRFPFLHRHIPLERLMMFADETAKLTRGEGRCLLRSLLVLWLFEARGESPGLWIGVKKDAGMLSSHAWIETRGVVRGESYGRVAGFIPFIRVP